MLLIQINLVSALSISSIEFEMFAEISKHKIICDINLISLNVEIRGNNMIYSTHNGVIKFKSI